MMDHLTKHFRQRQVSSHRNRLILADIHYLIDTVAMTVCDPCSFLFHTGLMFLSSSAFAIHTLTLTRIIACTRSSLLHALVLYPRIRGTEGLPAWLGSVSAARNWAVYQIPPDSELHQLVGRYPAIVVGESFQPQPLRTTSNPLAALILSFSRASFGS
jgi:hypothetical protein